MELVCVGKISKPQGIRGEIKVYPQIDTSAIFNMKVDFYLDKKPIKLSSCVYRGGYAYIKIDGINDRNEAEKLRNHLLYIEKETFYKYSQKEYLLEDLVGQSVFDEKEQLIGQVMGVENYGSDDLFIIQETDERIYQVPFVSAIFHDISDNIYVDRKEYEGAKVDYEN